MKFLQSALVVFLLIVAFAAGLSLTIAMLPLIISVAFVVVVWTAVHGLMNKDKP